MNDELERLMREALALVRLGPLTKHEHQELDSLMTRAVNALPELLAENARLRDLCDLAMPILEAAIEKGIPVTAEWTERLQSLHARAALKETG